MTDRQPIFVFLSGTGKTLEAIVRGCTVAKVEYVFSDQSDAMGLTVARDAGVFRLAHFGSGELNHINAYEYMVDRCGIVPKLIVLAGYMKILPADFISHMKSAGVDIINIHPSLLPKHKGLNTHQRALDSGDAEHGFTVHYVTEQLDSGPIIYQTKFDILDNDTVDNLSKAVKIRERLVYPTIIDNLLHENTKTISG